MNEYNSLYLLIYAYICNHTYIYMHIQPKYIHIQATRHVEENRAGMQPYIHIQAYIMCLYVHVLEIHKEAQCMYLSVSVCIYLYMSVYD